jgi:hypothetical protein
MAIQPRRDRQTGEVRELPDDGVLLCDHASKGIEPVARVPDLLAERRELLGGVVQLLIDRGIRLRITAARRRREDDEKTEGNEAPDWSAHMRTET